MPWYRCLLCVPWRGEQWAFPVSVGLLAAWGGWCVSVCGGLLVGLGWIGSLWLSLVGSRVVPLVYPPLEVGQTYVLALGTAEHCGGRSRGKHPWSHWGVLPWCWLGLVWWVRQEDVTDAGEGFRAFIVQCCRYIFDVARQEVEGMDYAVFWRYCWLC